MTLLVETPAKHVWMLENHFRNLELATIATLDFPGVAKVSIDLLIRYGSVLCSMVWHDTCC